MTLGVYFTRTDRSIRAWFPAVRNGELVAGALSTDFTVTVIDSLDAGSLLPDVTESTQRSGMYYFDVPASYLLASGVGDYGVSIQIDKNTNPKVTDVLYGHLRVSQEDFDSLSGSIWNSQASIFNTSGTMGWLQNQIIDTLASGSGVTFSSSSIDNLVDSIWNEPNGEHVISGTTGDSLMSASNPAISASVSVDNAAIAAEVWNSSTSSFNTAGTMGASMNKIRAMTCGRWIISGSQMIFYDDDNTTEVARFNLFDTEGDAFFSEPNAPAERVVV